MIAVGRGRDRRDRPPRRWQASAQLVVVAAAVGLLVGAPMAPVGAQVAPEPLPLVVDTTITAPGQHAVLAPGPLVIEGEATAPAGVSAVKLFIQDPVTRQWLQPDGSWGAWTWLTASVAAPGATRSAWTLAIAAPSENAYSVWAEARAADGSRDVTRAQRQVFVGTPPDGGLSSPAAGAAVLAPVTLGGWASDDRGVDRVRIAIQDPVTRRWWRDGTWSTFGWLETSVAARGAPSTTWSWTWTAAPAGRFSVFVEAIDADGLPDPTKGIRAVDVAAPGPAFLTLVIGRSDWGIAEACTPPAGAVTLDRVAAELAARGLTATGGVVPSRTVEQGTGCWGQAIALSSWEQLGWLRDTYGWTFFPRAEQALDGLPSTQVEAETCGARQVLEARGHTRARGLFAYPNNAIDETVQDQVVATCFAFGRRYGDGLTTRAGVVPPFWQRTRSFNGGRCNDAADPCSQMTVANGRTYESPELLASLLAAGPGEWRTVQLYRFVEGAGTHPGNQWDCTSTDWRRHWTSRAEVYCWSDYLAALDAIPADVVVTDPLTVAEAWGRLVP